MKWGGGGWGSLRDLSKNILKQGVGKSKVVHRGVLKVSPPLPPRKILIIHLPTGNFKWMTDKEISKIDLGKYKADGKKGLILEVDLEYPQELHDIHNDYPVAPEKVKVSNNMLSAYCKKIAEKYNISVGLMSKFIPTLRDKKEYVLQTSALRNESMPKIHSKRTSSN